MIKAVRKFCINAAVIFVIVCLCQCFALLQGGGMTYPVYCAVLVLGGVLGAGVITAVSEFASRDEYIEMRSQKAKIAELESSITTLKEVATRREEFIGSFAHELKTPLTAIIGYADMLRSKDMAPRSRFTAAGYIFSEGKRLEALSLKLMDIIVAGNQGIELKHFDAGYFIRSVAAVVMPSLSNAGMTLDMVWEPGYIMIEPDLFKTLVINLVDNARKASKKGDHITLSGKVEDGGYALYVKDEGTGMKKSELGKITEPFYMIDKSRSRAQNGAGLGLALCQRIVELHETKLEYDSELGKGTTVRILMKGGAPLESDDEEE